MCNSYHSVYSANIHYTFYNSTIVNYDEIKNALDKQSTTALDNVFDVEEGYKLDKNNKLIPLTLGISEDGKEVVELGADVYDVKRKIKWFSKNYISLPLDIG